jgi:hypothetical protein
MDFSALSLLVFGLATLTNVQAISPGFPYGSQKVRGVNIGGWLVTEVGLLKTPIHERFGVTDDVFIAMDYPFPLRQHWKCSDYRRVHVLSIPKQERCRCRSSNTLGYLYYSV